MTIIVDYASLTTSIADWAHRSDLTSGATPYSDAFIQRAQLQIERDIPTKNFGNYIRFQEAAYPPTPISGGICPVPTDWLGPKSFQVLDGSGAQFPLIFKAATWLYNTYPQRASQGLPAYIARDTWNGQTNFLEYSTALGQTNFSLTGISGGVVYATLDGQLLVLATDYNVSGSTFVLSSGAVSGQTLFIQGAIPGFSASNNVQATATAGQASFSISGLTSGSQVLFVALDGAVLPPSDYTVSGTTLVLGTAALLGQVLFVQGAPSTLSTSPTSAFIFGPYPDSAYTVQGTYYQHASRLSSTNTTNWMVQYSPDLILAACMVEAARFLKDSDMLQLWGQDYGTRLVDLITADKAERWAASTLQVETA